MPQIRLHLREADGDLPNACMCCGAEATVTRTKNLQWCPSWVGILILAGLLPYVIVAMIMTKRARLQAPLCDQHKGHWLNRTLLVLGLAFVLAIVGVGSLVVAANLPREHQELTPIVCLGDVLLFIGWLVIWIFAQNTAIRPKEITDTEILLDGVSQEFIDIVAEEDRRRQERRGRRRREEFDDDEDREDYDEDRRRRRPSSDAFEE